MLGLIVLLLINIGRLGNIYFRDGVAFVIVLAGWAVYCEFRRTVLTVEGVRLFELRQFWRIRSIFVPWQDVLSIDSHLRGGQRYVVVHLTDGRKFVLSAPADLFDKPRFDRELATMREWRTNYGRTPASQ